MGGGGSLKGRERSRCGSMERRKQKQRCKKRLDQNYTNGHGQAAKNMNASGRACICGGRRCVGRRLRWGGGVGAGHVAHLRGWTIRRHCVQHLVFIPALRAAHTSAAAHERGFSGHRKRRGERGGGARPTCRFGSLCTRAHRGDWQRRRRTHRRRRRMQPCRQRLR